METSSTGDPPSSNPPQADRRRGLVGVAIQVVVLAVLMVVVARFIDREQIRRAFESVSLGSFLVFAVLMIGMRMIAAYRWLVVARDHVGLKKLDFGFLVRVELLADFAGIWMQTLIGGEAVRVWKIIRRTGEKALGPGSVVLDRFVGTAGLGLACLPFAVILVARTPELRLPAVLDGNVDLVVGAALAALLAVLLALHYVEALRRLARRAVESAVRSRFLAVPLAISWVNLAALVAAHYWGVPELAQRGWLVTATFTLLPRLGQAIPLSVFGITAVEGAMFGVGALLGLEAETILAVVALNLTVRYLGAFAGALAEISRNGTRFFRDVRKEGAASLAPDPPETRRERS